MRNLHPNKAVGCWMLRITRNKVPYQENFSIREYGSWEAAERAGTKRLKEIMAITPPPLSAKNRKTRRNSSGKVGVSLRPSTKHGEHGSWIYFRWVGFWPRNPAGSSWAIDKYGDERAYICACIARELETTDRELIESEYQSIKGSAKYKNWLKQKAQEPQ